VNLKKIFIIIAIIIIGFTAWSLADTVCVSCERLFPDRAREDDWMDGNMDLVCMKICLPEPRWVSWLYG
jgi:hypothetical protein